METLAVLALVLQLSGVAGADGQPIAATTPPGGHPVAARTSQATRRSRAWFPAPALRSAAADDHSDAQEPPAQGQGRVKTTPPPAPPGPDLRFDPIVAAWSTEPAMACGGLTLASVQRFASRLLSSTEGARAHPGLAAAWEFPFALGLSTVTHEVDGHGGRARKFGLHAHYGFDPLRLSAFTSTDEVPKTADDIISISAGGTEADSVLANRLFVDLLRPDGAEASTVPLAVIAKVDLTLYVLSTEVPDAGNATAFRDQYQQGNDIANYLVGRQGQRRGIDVNDLWNQVAPIDFNEPLLRRNYDAARDAAIWNLLDPVMVTTTLEYVREHLGHGAGRIGPPMLRLSESVHLSAGTRAFLAPSYVTRYLDVYARVPVGVGSFYVRDLDSSIERKWGWGARFMLAPEGWRLSATFSGDRWNEPASAEHGPGGSGWNVEGEVRVPVASRFGVLLNGGRKTAGFVPGRPVGEGNYAGVGVLVSPW